MVEEESLPIIWSPIAKRSFKKAYQRIKKDSPKNAENVRDTIQKMVDRLPDNPQFHPPDRFKRNNSGNYRAFEKYKFRVTYRILQSLITIFPSL